MVWGSPTLVSDRRAQVYFPFDRRERVVHLIRQIESKAVAQILVAESGWRVRLAEIPYKYRYRNARRACVGVLGTLGDWTLAID